MPPPLPMHLSCPPPPSHTPTQSPGHSPSPHTLGGPLDGRLLHRRQVLRPHARVHGVAHVRAAEAGLREQRVRQVREREVRAAEVRVDEVREGQVAVREVAAAEVAALQVGPGQARVPQERALELGRPQVGLDEGGVREVCGTTRTCSLCPAVARGGGSGAAPPPPELKLEFLKKRGNAGEIPSVVFGQ